MTANRMTACLFTASGHFLNHEQVLYMGFLESYQLLDELEEIESFLYEIINTGALRRRRGLSHIGKKNAFLKLPEALSTLETRLHNFSRTANILNPVLGKHFELIFTDSPLCKGSAELSVLLNMSSRHEELKTSTKDPIMKFFMLLEERFFRSADATSLLSSSEYNLDIKGMLVDIERIKPIIKSVQSEMYARTENDFETFKPSNISIDNVNLFVQNALSIVSDTDTLNSETKENIEEYLKDIKAELAQESPAWKKIVGALVIVSAILGGLDAAPDALDNVRDAIQEILGTSVDEIPRKPRSHQNQLPNFTITKNRSDDGTQEI